MPMTSLTDWYHGVVDVSQLDRWHERRLGPNRVERTRIERGTRALATRPRKPTSSLFTEVPELRADATPSLTVRLGVGALDGIIGELQRSHGLLGAVETGGNVFGRLKGKTIELIYASGPGSDGKARRLPDSVMVSLADGYQHARDLERIYQSDIRFLGGWHTHPIRQPLPSATDRSEGLVALDQLHALGHFGTTSWIDLILIPDLKRGWEAPSVRGWATRRSDLGAVTEPVRVVE